MNSSQSSSKLSLSSSVCHFLKVLCIADHSSLRVRIASLHVRSSCCKTHGLLAIGVVLLVMTMPQPECSKLCYYACIIRRTVREKLQTLLSHYVLIDSSFKLISRYPKMHEKWPMASCYVFLTLTMYAILSKIHKILTVNGL